MEITSVKSFIDYYEKSGQERIGLSQLYHLSILILPINLENLQ